MHDDDRSTPSQRHGRAANRHSILGRLGARLRPRDAGRPYVVDADGRRTLHFDGLTIQSEMLVDEPDSLALDYTRAMMGFLLFNPDPAHVAMIGLGGGSLAKYCLGTLPRARFTAIEIDAAVIALRARFGVPEDGPRFRIVRADGADYVRDQEETPDVLLVDGFDAAGQPQQLCSAAFYDDCRSMLADNGVLVVNLWAGDPRYSVYIARIRESFGRRLVAIPAEEGSNRIVFACKGATFPPPRGELLARARALAHIHSFGIMPLAQRVQHRLDRLTASEHA